MARTLVSIVAVVLAWPAAAETIHVDVANAGNPGQDGSSLSPYGTVQAGIDAAEPGDTVVVADGVYTGDGNRDIDPGGRAITIASANGPSTCTLDAGGTARELHRVFHLQSGETTATRIEGFTITGGFAVGGAGMRCDGASPTIVDCVFADNQEIGLNFFARGAGLRSDGGSPLVERCRFQGNVLVSHLVECYDGIAAGGGAWMKNGSPVFRDCTFVANTCSAGDSASGGAILLSTTTDARIERCIFRANAAMNNPGCGDTTGGAVSIVGPATGTRIDNCLFECNRVTNYDAHAKRLGAAVWEVGHDTVLTNCTLVGNYGNGSNPTPVTVVNSLLGTASLVNCIVWDFDDPPFSAMGSVTHCIVQGGYAGVGNVADDPMFIAPQARCDMSGDAGGNLRLQPGSPAIDSGDNTAVPPDILTDLDGGARFIDHPDTPDTGVGTAPIVDRGAYELSCAGDTNGDGVIDVDDLNNVILDWGTDGSAHGGDVAGAGPDSPPDRIVDVNDLNAIIVGWGTCS